MAHVAALEGGNHPMFQGLEALEAHFPTSTYFNNGYLDLFGFIFHILDLFSLDKGYTLW